jgi:hypothetical protein
MAVVKRAKQRDLPLEPFTVHDLQRTESTRLNEFGFSSDRIEKSFLEVSRQKESVA